METHLEELASCVQVYFDGERDDEKKKVRRYVKKEKENRTDKVKENVMYFSQ